MSAAGASPVPAVPAARFALYPQAKAAPTARFLPLARALRTVPLSARRAKWLRQCRAAERFAFFAPPGMASPSASLRGSAFVYFRRFPPLRNLQQPALRALFCIQGNRKIPPRKFRGLGSRSNPCHPSVCAPAPAAPLIHFRSHKLIILITLLTPPWSQNKKPQAGSGGFSSP